MNFNITSKVNNHSKLSIRGLLNNNFDINSVLGNSSINIRWKENSNYSLFNGTVEKSVFTYKNNSVVFELICLGSSYKMDCNSNNRTYFDKNMDYKDILENTLKEYNGIGIVSSNINKAITTPIIQYQETDWQFILRLASYLETSVFVHESSTPSIRIGKKSKKNIRLNEASAINKVESHKLYYRVDTYNQFEIGLGDAVTFYNGNGIVSKKNIIFDKGILQCSYFITNNISSENIPLIGNPNFAGTSLEGTVIQTKNELIKVVLDIDSEYNFHNNAFFSYAPVSGNIFYSMPEIGSKVLLYFPNNFETSAYFTATLLSDNNIFKRHNDKILITPHRRSIEFKQRDFTISDPNNYVRIDDPLNVMFYSGTSLTVNCESKISIKSGGLIGVNTVENLLLDYNNISSIGLNLGEATFKAARIVASTLKNFHFEGLEDNDVCIKDLEHTIIGSVPDSDSENNLKIDGAVPTVAKINYPIAPSKSKGIMIK